MNSMMATSSRRFGILVIAFLAIAAFVFYSSSTQTTVTNGLLQVPKSAQSLKTSSNLAQTPGKAIAPKLGNETAKAELGRSAWRLLHTMMARFPDEPTQDESEALRNYIYLFQRLYPCGECAQHFGVILEQFPPQVSSRSVAAVWACHVHNEVNKSLNKELFDCANIGDFYDCGCAEDEKSSKQAKKQPG